MRLSVGASRRPDVVDYVDTHGTSVVGFVFTEQSDSLYWNRMGSDE